MSSYSKAIGQRASSSASASAAGVNTARQRAAAQKRTEAQAVREAKREAQRNALIDKLAAVQKEIGRLHGAGDVAGRDKAITHLEKLQGQLKALSATPLRAPGRPKSAVIAERAKPSTKVSKTPKTPKTPKAAQPALKAIGRVDPALLGPDRPLNPYVLQQMYGNAQLRQALDGRSLVALKQAVAIVQERHPGTSPANRTQKAAMTNYILHHVAGEPLAATGAKVTKSAKSDAKPSASNAAPAPKAAQPPLKAIARVDPVLLGPDRPLNPYVLKTMYGTSQLRQALDGRSLVALKQAVAAVQQRHPGTAPKNRTQKAALIDYITQHVSEQDHI